MFIALFTLLSILSTKEEIKREETFQSILEASKKQELLVSQIPQDLHFVYFDDRPLCHEKIERLRRWKELHSDWKITFWSHKKQKDLPIGIEFRLSHSAPFKDLSKYAAESSLVPLKERLFALDLLKAQGGVVASFDLEPTDRIDPLLSSSFICLLGEPDSYFTGARNRLSMSFIAATANHPFFEPIEKSIASRWAEIESALYLDDQGSNLLRINEHTVIPYDESLLKELERNPFLGTLVKNANGSFKISPIKEESPLSPLQQLSSIRSKIRHRDHYLLTFGLLLLLGNGFAFWIFNRKLVTKSS